MSEVIPYFSSLPIPTAREVVRDVQESARIASTAAIGISYSHDGCLLARICQARIDGWPAVSVRPYRTNAQAYKAADGTVKILPAGVPHIEIAFDTLNTETDTYETTRTIVFMQPDLARLGRLFDTFPRHTRVYPADFLALVAREMPWLLEDR